MIPRPLPGEYSPYAETYVHSIPAQADVLELLDVQQNDVVQLLARVSESESNFAYAPDKWTIKQLLGHMIDTERIMAYRALCIARGEKANLPGFEENEYVTNANFEDRTLNDLLDEHKAVRGASLALFKSLSEEAYTRTGSANGHPVTTAALLYIIVGHERHHLSILKERYLAKL